MRTASPVRYVIDAQDRLTELNEAWSVFADENAGHSLRPAQVLGRPLWEFLADATTTSLYRAMVKRVRDGGLPVRFQFRCDAPHLRRGLAMEITAVERGSVVFEVTPVWEDAGTPMPLLDIATPRADGLLTICGWCKRIPLADDRWVEIELAVMALGLFGGAALPRLSHGMCPDCTTVLLGALEPGAGLVIVGDVPIVP